MKLTNKLKTTICYKILHKSNKKDIILSNVLVDRGLRYCQSLILSSQQVFRSTNLFLDCWIRELLYLRISLYQLTSQHLRAREEVQANRGVSNFGLNKRTWIQICSIIKVMIKVQTAMKYLTLVISKIQSWTKSNNLSRLLRLVRR
jgi:hypothetical protein